MKQELAKKLCIIICTNEYIILDLVSGLLKWKYSSTKIKLLKFFVLACHLLQVRNPAINFRVLLSWRNNKFFSVLFGYFLLRQMLYAWLSVRTTFFFEVLLAGWSERPRGKPTSRRVAFVVIYTVQVVQQPATRTAQHPLPAPPNFSLGIIRMRTRREALPQWAGSAFPLTGTSCWVAELLCLAG